MHAHQAPLQKHQLLNSSIYTVHVKTALLDTIVLEEQRPQSYALMDIIALLKQPTPMSFLALQELSILQ